MTQVLQVTLHTSELREVVVADGVGEKNSLSPHNGWLPGDDGYDTRSCSSGCGIITRSIVKE
jgi:hypothetical protein